MRSIFAFVACVLLATPAAAITLRFNTEDDFVTPLINGQIVDDAKDVSNLEFGTHVNISSTGTNLGATIFDGDPTGPNSGGTDQDLLVDTRTGPTDNYNILMLQNTAFPSTTNVAGFGDVFDTPNDEADMADAGNLVFDFVTPSFMQSIDIIDANGGFEADVVLIDSSGFTRTYNIPEMWTFDINTCGASCPPATGWSTLDLTSLANQTGEGGVDATATEDALFDAFDVVTLEVRFFGTAGGTISGGIDNLTFVPEPTTGLMLALGLVGLAWGRRRSTR